MPVLTMTYRPPAKSWDQLSPAYQRRMSKAGLNAKNWASKDGAAIRQAARGHGKTPEHPERAVKSPERFREYLDKRVDLERRVIAKKDRVWGSTLKFNAVRANSNVFLNPVTGRPPSVKYMNRFLKMSVAEIERINWKQDDEWAFLFYH
jgi:hypothetical protein